LFEINKLRKHKEASKLSSKEAKAIEVLNKGKQYFFNNKIAKETFDQLIHELSSLITTQFPLLNILRRRNIANYMTHEDVALIVVLSLEIRSKRHLRLVIFPS
jgi:YHS domain-containing protein